LIWSGGKAAAGQLTAWACPYLIYRKNSVAVKTCHSGKGKHDAHHRTAHPGLEGELRYNRTFL